MGRTQEAVEAKFETIVIGAGPAGTGLFVAAASEKQLGNLVKSGVGLVNPSLDIGPGNFRRYKIQSNSSGLDFVEAIEPGGDLGHIRVWPNARLVEAHGLKTVYLPFVANLLQDIGSEIGKALEEDVDSGVLQAKAAYIDHEEEGGGVVNKIKDRFGNTIASSKNVVIAVGGREECNPDLESYKDKVVFSNEVISEEGLAKVATRPALFEHKRVAILGGSHSAFSAARKLLDVFADCDLKLQVVTRSPVKAFYDTLTEALLAGERIEADNICPIKGRVFRFGGIRGISKDLHRAVQSDLEKRVKIGLFPLDEADCIVQATGYKPNEIPIYERGERIGPLKDDKGQVVVDDNCRIFRKDGELIPGIYATGLGYGIKPSPEIGGEPSFRGRLDAVNLYQGLVGLRIMEQII